MTETTPLEIELGASGADFRHWLAAEAKRQGEIRLNAQAANIASMEARATSILSWAVATLVALATLASQGHGRAAAALAGICLMITAISCIAALMPGHWHPPGYDSATLSSFGLMTELEMNEKISFGYEAGILANDARSRRFAACLRCAWFWFVLAPVMAAAGDLLFSA